MRKLRRLGSWVTAFVPACAALVVVQPCAASESLLPRPSLQALASPAAQAPARPAVFSAHRRSMYKAALLSALLPGLGEYVSGHRTRALVSGSLEAAVWTSYITFKVQEDLRGDRAREYAVSFAGALPDGDEDYYKAVGMFLRTEGPGQWNEFVRRRARDTGEIVGREYGGDEAWAWTSLDRFIEYRLLRRDMLAAEENARDTLAFALVNRIISIVSVVQAIRADAHAEEERGLGLKLEMGTTPREPSARVGLWNRF